MQSTLLTIAEKSVKLSTVLKQVRSMPVVEVKLSEFAFVSTDEENPDSSSRADQVVCAVRSKNFEEPNEIASVYMVHGKYIVVTGKALIVKFIAANTPIFKVRLISKQALKHMLTTETPVVTESVAPIPQYERPTQYARETNYRDRRPDERSDRPFNPPRVFDSRPPQDSRFSQNVGRAPSPPVNPPVPLNFTSKPQIGQNVRASLQSTSKPTLKATPEYATPQKNSDH